MRIWRASPDEAPQVAALLAGFRDHLGRDWPPDEAFLRTVRRLIVRDDVEYLLAARDDQPPQGVAQLRFRLGVWMDAEDCWLEDLFVRDEARGAGLGRALAQAALERAAERGCRRVELDVNTENGPALALYRSLGFETGKTGGQDLLMRRSL
jgi:ribosomal protein S18 acetylase RimI-like enzyme